MRRGPRARTPDRQPSGERWIDPSAGDWLGTTDDLLERIRPKNIYERAIIVGAVIFVVGLNIAAYQMQPNPVRYEFMNMGSYVIIADRLVGQVAACRPTADAVVCTQEDSPGLAALRRSDAEWKAQEKLWSE